MADLKDYGNIFADLSQSSYNNRKDLSGENLYNFANGLKDKQREALNDGKSVTFNFPNAKDAYGNKIVGVDDKGNKVDGLVYLHPDKITTKEVTSTLQTPNPNGGYSTEKFTTKLETNLSQVEFTGFNSYFVTDAPSIQKSTETYFVTRGSDSYENFHDLLTDWIQNDINFGLFNSHIPQAKLAEKAMEAKIKELPIGAVMNVTGHSLGTMVVNLLKTKVGIAA